MVKGSEWQLIFFIPIEFSGSIYAYRVSFVIAYSVISWLHDMMLIWGLRYS